MAESPAPLGPAAPGSVRVRHRARKKARPSPAHGAQTPPPATPPRASCCSGGRPDAFPTFLTLEPAGTRPSPLTPDCRWPPGEQPRSCFYHPSLENCSFAASCRPRATWVPSRPRFDRDPPPPSPERESVCQVMREAPCILHTRSDSHPKVSEPNAEIHGGRRIGSCRPAWATEQKTLRKTRG